MHQDTLYNNKKGPVPELALQNADFPVHRVCRFIGILELPLHLSTLGVRSGHLLLRLFQLALQLAHTYICLLRLQRRGSLSEESTSANRSLNRGLKSLTFLFYNQKV